MDLRNYLLAANGTPQSGATVTYKTASAAEPNGNGVLGTTTTNASGMWEFTGIAAGNYDVYVVSGSNKIIYKGLAALPHSFGDGQIAAAADIALTKLHPGTLADVTPDGTATTFADRLNDITSAIRLLLGTGHFYDNAASTIAALFAKFHDSTGHVHTATGSNGPKVDHITGLTSIGTNAHSAIDTAITNSATHIAAALAVHGIGASNNVVGSRDGAGRWLNSAPITVGSESTGSGLFFASASITWTTAYAAAPRVAVTFKTDTTPSRVAWGAVGSPSTTGATVWCMSTVTGMVAGQVLDVIAWGG